MHTRFLLCLLLAFSAPAVAASTAATAGDIRPVPDGKGTSTLAQAVLRLPVVASMLHTGAHPDDENSALVAYVSRGLHARTAYLSLNRGEGGQNLIGPELYDAIGVIRTEELLTARRFDGAEQFFTRTYDFGFSKSAEETLEYWNHDEMLLSDVVRVIRRFRPDVIVSVFRRFSPRRPRASPGGREDHPRSLFRRGRSGTLSRAPAGRPASLAGPQAVHQQHAGILRQHRLPGGRRRHLQPRAGPVVPRTRPGGPQHAPLPGHGDPAAEGSGDHEDQAGRARGHGGRGHGGRGRRRPPVRRPGHDFHAVPCHGRTGCREDPRSRRPARAAGRVGPRGRGRLPAAGPSRRAGPRVGGPADDPGAPGRP